MIVFSFMPLDLVPYSIMSLFEINRSFLSAHQQRAASAKLRRSQGAINVIILYENMGRHQIAPLPESQPEPGSHGLKKTGIHPMFLQKSVEGHIVTRIFLILLFITLPAICLAQEKVYTNEDLKKDAGTPESYTYPAGTAVVTPPPPAAPAPASGQTNPDSSVRQQPLPAQNPVNPVAQGIRNAPVPPRPDVMPSRSSSRLVNSIMNPFAREFLWLLLAAAAQFILWMIALIDILRNEFTGNNKLIWFLAVTFIPLVGPILYFFIGADQKIRFGGDEGRGMQSF
jgi:hypothetical protein